MVLDALGISIFYSFSSFLCYLYKVIHLVFSDFKSVANMEKHLKI